MILTAIDNSQMNVLLQKGDSRVLLKLPLAVFSLIFFFYTDPPIEISSNWSVNLAVGSSGCKCRWHAAHN